MSFPRPVAWLLLLGAFFVSGLLRQWNETGPAGLLLTLLLVLFAALLLRGRRREAAAATGDGASPGSPGPIEQGVPAAALVPLLLLVIADKWFSLVVFEPSLVWIPGIIEDRALAGIVYVLMTALGLFAVCLLGVFFFRTLWRRVRRLLSPRALVTAAALIVVSLVTLYGLLFAFLFLVRDQMLWEPGFYRDPVLAVMLCAQAVRAVAEELYFRGLLQENLVPLLTSMGIPSTRRAKMAAIGLVSLLFVLEHAGMEGDALLVARELAFVGYMSALFGVVLVISRSLYLSMGFHFVVNLFLVRGGLVFVDPTNGEEIFEPRLFGLLYSLLLFIVLFAVTGQRRRARLRAREARAS